MVLSASRVYDHGAGLISDVLDEVPEGWKVMKGAAMAPRGYMFACNGKSRFANPSEYKSALVPIEAALRHEQMDGKQGKHEKQYQQTLP